MKPNTLDQLLKALSTLAFLLLGMILLGGCNKVYDPITMVEFFIVFLLGFSIVGLGFIYLTPVRCFRPECDGWMKPGWITEYAGFQFLWRLFYECETCDSVYNSSFSFSIGGGEP